MKFIVDKMPVDKKHCPFQEVIHAPGEVVYKSLAICKLDNKECNFKDSPPNVHYISCRWLKEIT